MTQTPLRLLQIGAWLICGCLSVPTLTLLANDSAGQTKRPNILYLLVDDLGWADLGCYGSDLHETPHIDKLASSAVRFTNAYAAAETTNGKVVLQHDNTLTQDVPNLHQTVSGSPTFIANNPLTGDPKLSDSYHLQSGSAAIDAGVDAGVTTDIDGDARPQGSAPDIGADEFTEYNIYLPCILKN